MSKLLSKANEIIALGKKYWNTPAEGNYVPYKEVATLGAAGFGVHWTSLLASTIGLDAANFLVGASIGLKPLDLQLMLIIANLVGLPIAFLRGWLFDNHHMKGGKFIPFIVRSSFPIVFISAVFVWLPYENFSYITKAVVVWCFYMLIQFFLCFYNEGWSFFQQVITPNAQERATVMSISQIIYSLAPTITNFVIPTIAGLTFGLNNIMTYRIIYPIFTVIGLIVNVFFFSKLKERIILPKKKMEYVSIIDSLREVAKNKYFWIINSASWVGFLETAYGVILSWSFVYAYGGEKQEQLGIANAFIGNASLWSMILAPILISKLGKRNLLISCNIINIVLLLILFPTYKSLFAICLIFYLNSFVNTFGNIYLPNINADMRDYHQWKTGVRVDGLFGPLGLIGTVLGFFTGLVVPAVYEHMGLKDDYNILYNDTMRNDLFKVLILLSVLGAVLNLIPYLFYDLTESKHKGYINVLKIRAMFEDYGNGNLDDNELCDAMEIINTARELNGQEKIKIDKSSLKEAKAMPKRTDEEKEIRRSAIHSAKESIRDQKKRNDNIECMPIVIDELNKFSTLRYQKQLESAKETYNNGELYFYENADELLRNAKHLPKATKEEKKIRSDEIKLARMKKNSSKIISRHQNNLSMPTEEQEKEIQERETKTLKESLQARRDLKKLVKARSLYYRAIAPYTNAKNLIIQAENYTHLSELEQMYNAISV